MRAIEDAAEVTPCTQPHGPDFEAIAFEPAAPYAVPLIVFRFDPVAHRARRLLDIVLASTGLVVTFPVMLAAAAAIVLDDGLPVMFCQQRVGRFGKRFNIFKLRTMGVRDSGDRLSPRSARDARITRVGRILRSTSIDELPQLLNVVLGDMALVGPRPEMPFVVRSYRNWQHLRHLVTPGITGVWQITARKTLALERPEATLLDLEYVRNASLTLDVRLIARTFVAVLARRGAY